MDLERTLVFSTASYTCRNIAGIYDNKFAFAAVITGLWRALDWMYFFLTTNSQIKSLGIFVETIAALCDTYYII